MLKEILFHENSRQARQVRRVGQRANRGNRTRRAGSATCWRCAWRLANCRR